MIAQGFTNLSSQMETVTKTVLKVEQDEVEFLQIQVLYIKVIK